MTECSSPSLLVLFTVCFLLLCVSAVVVVLLFLTFPGVGRDQPEGRYQESTLSGHAVLSPTVVLLSLCGCCVCVRLCVCERVRARSCPRSLGRVAVGSGLSTVWPSVSRPDGRRCLAVWPLDSRRVAWPHLCTLGWGS